MSSSSKPWSKWLKPSPTLPSSVYLSKDSSLIVSHDFDYPLQPLAPSYPRRPRKLRKQPPQTQPPGLILLNDLPPQLPRLSVQSSSSLHSPTSTVSHTPLLASSSRPSWYPPYPPPPPPSSRTPKPAPVPPNPTRKLVKRRPSLPILPPDAPTYDPRYSIPLHNNSNDLTSSMNGHRRTASVPPSAYPNPRRLSFWKRERQTPAQSLHDERSVGPALTRGRTTSTKLPAVHPKLDMEVEEWKPPPPTPHPQRTHHSRAISFTSLSFLHPRSPVPSLPTRSTAHTVRTSSFSSLPPRTATSASTSNFYHSSTQNRLSGSYVPLPTSRDIRTVSAYLPPSAPASVHGHGTCLDDEGDDDDDAGTDEVLEFGGAARARRNHHETYNPYRDSCVAPPQPASIDGVLGIGVGMDVPDDICEKDLTPEARTARRALLCCRDVVRTERRYQDGLRALLAGETTVPPPSLMQTYLPALVRASETFLQHLNSAHETHSLSSLPSSPTPSADAPSMHTLSSAVYAVATAIVASEVELESALAAWSGVVGEFFSSPSLPARPGSSSGVGARLRRGRAGTGSGSGTIAGNAAGANGAIGRRRMSMIGGSWVWGGSGSGSAVPSASTLTSASGSAPGSASLSTSTSTSTTTAITTPSVVDEKSVDVGKEGVLPVPVPPHPATTVVQRTMSIISWRKSVSSLASLDGREGRRGEKNDGSPKKGREGRKPSVRDLAIQPTQRVMRYVLLYRDLLAYTPTTSPARSQVEAALGAALRIAQKCDRAQGNAAFFLSQRA